MSTGLLAIAAWLVEAGREEKEPEAPVDGPFGQWAWASRREAMPDEPDNLLEDLIFEQLKKHFSSSRTGLPQETADFLARLMEAGMYEPVLHSPPQETLYRGLKLRGKVSLATFLGIDPSEVEETGSLDFPETVTIPTTNGFSTSWSSKRKITEDFSQEGERGYAVTLVASVSGNPFRFIAGPGGLYNVDGMSRWHLEKETVGLEPIRVRRIEWERIG